MVREDPQALPFARLHGNVQAMAGKEDLLAALSNPDRVPLVAMTLGPDSPNFNGPPSVTPFTTRRLNGNRVRLEGSSEQPGLLVVSEQFDPGWRARVNGKPVPISPADHLLIGVPLEAGSNRVDLVYAPDTFRVGLFGTLLGIACLTGLLCVRRRPAVIVYEPDAEPGPNGRRRRPLRAS
jgi:hypothetical protein